MDFEYSDLLKMSKAKDNETIVEHTENLIKQAELLKNFGYIKDDDVAKDLITACYYHDFGKVNEQFQYRINNKTKFNEAEEVPHNILSVFFIDKNNCINYENVFFAVLYHHYKEGLEYKNYIKERFDLIKNNLSAAGIVIPSEFQTLKTVNKMRKIKELKLEDKEKQKAVLIKGLLHRCDYSASANIQCEIKNDFLNNVLYNWKINGNKIYNELQNFCIQNTDKNIIVTAPTGMGKTEAGLLWCGDNKCFFVLPLESAINAMYERIKKLSGDSYTERVALLHSDMMTYYYEHRDYDSDINEYYNDSKQMSLPITVCTPDQIFDFVLKYPGYEYKLAISSYSKFIIDEIQMYSPDLLASILYAIKMIHTMGGKIAVLTATLPPFVRDKLKEIFGEDIPQADFSKYGVTRHNIKVHNKTLCSEDICNIVEKTNSDNIKKYLVICNSVDDTTIKLYNELKNEYKDEIKVNLLHSKFIKRDRAEKETEILKAPDDRTTTEIWISTSLVEASLDIDFDILVTELSDLFSLFQRMGRVNRKGEKDFSDTNVYIFTEKQGEASKYIDDTIYEQSKKAINSIGDIIIDEQKKVELIEEYLSTEKIMNSQYRKEFDSCYKYISDLFEYEKSKKDKFRNIDTVDAIPEDIYKNEIENNDDISNKDIRKLTVSVPHYYLYYHQKPSYYTVDKVKFPVLYRSAFNYDKDTGLTSKKNINNKDFDNIISDS